MSLRLAIRIINLVALLLAVAWYAQTYALEPAIVGLGLLSAYATQEVLDRRSAGPPTIHPEATWITGDLGRQNVNPEALEWFIRGRKARDQNRIKTARAYFDRAISLQPNYWEALYERAYCDRRLGNYDLSAKTLEELIQNCPAKNEVWMSHNELGMVYSSQGDYENAFRQYEIAFDTCDKKEGNPVPLANLVIYAYVTGRNEEGNSLRQELMQHPAYEKVRAAAQEQLSSYKITVELPPSKK